MGHLSTASRRTTHILRHIRPSAPMSGIPAAAPWRDDLLAHIQTMDMPSFVLTTLHHTAASTSSARTTVTPRGRTVVFRGMWASLPANSKNPAALNPPGVYESDLPAITTDIRMEKIPELIQGDEIDGPFEAVFWMPAVNTQWRLRGRALVIGPDIESDAAAPVRDVLRRYMRASRDDGSWSWGRELTAHFGNLSPAMRGSFRNPPPGAPLSEKPSDGEGLGQTVDDLEDGLARRNFRVVVLVPEELDRVDLSDPKRARRWNYTRTGEAEANNWAVAEVWP